MADEIKNTSSTNEAVGGDVMAVELLPILPGSPFKIIVRYIPNIIRYAQIDSKTHVAQFPIAFWPWVITPTGYKAPSVSTYGGGSLTISGVKIEFIAPAQPAIPGILFAQSSQRRLPPPYR